MSLDGADESSLSASRLKQTKFLSRCNFGRCNLRAGFDVQENFWNGHDLSIPDWTGILTSITYNYE